MLAMHLAGDRDVYLAVNGSSDAVRFEIPQAGPNQWWREVVDTSRRPPFDIKEEGDASEFRESSLLVEPRSCRVLVGVS